MRQGEIFVRNPVDFGMTGSGKNGIFANRIKWKQNLFRLVIQRIQTVFLFLAFLLNGSVFFNALYSHAVQDPRAWIGIGFAIILTIASLGSLGCIFLYENRDNQLRWVGRLLIPQVIAFGFAVGIYISLGGFGTYLWDETIGLALLFFAFVAQLYARKKIKDDIELVKSMDRIR